MLFRIWKINLITFILDEHKVVLVYNIKQINEYQTLCLNYKKI